MLTSLIQQLIDSSLKQLSLPIVDHLIAPPANPAHGDYSTNVALATFSSIDHDMDPDAFSNPHTLATKLASVMATSLPPQLDRVEVAGPGFINFYIKPLKVLDQILGHISSPSPFGSNSLGSNRLVIVEYSSPNIAKPFTIGHLRSTIIGDAVANLLEFTGWRVMRDNHLGDWGTQFGKQIYAIKTWGDEDQIDRSPNPVKNLVALYVKFHQQAETDPSLNDTARDWFKKLESNQPEARRIWQKCIDWSWRSFSSLYSRLQITGFSPEFDRGRGLGESFFEDKMSAVIQELESKRLLFTGEGGAKLVDLDDVGLPPAMILKSDGTSLYITRDLATDKYRLDQYNPDLIINQVGQEQTLYFQQLFAIEHKLGWFKPHQRVHNGHGHFRFKHGKMSTRKGNVIWLEDVLDQAVSKASDLTSDRSSNIPLAHSVAIGALKWNDLKRSYSHQIIFDWDEVLSMQGNSGPYVQYTYARAHSVVSKAGDWQLPSKLNPPTFDLHPLEVDLISTFTRFPSIITQSAQEHSPHHLANYLYHLSQAYNSFYNSLPILGTQDKPLDQDIRQLRLCLNAVTMDILKSGLNILGIPVLTSM